MTTKMTDDSIMQLLDDLSAAFENVLVRHGPHMLKADLESRKKLVERARAICDAALRPHIDYDAAARNAGWLCRNGLWFNERFDGPIAASADGADVYESAKEVCEGEGIL